MGEETSEIKRSSGGAGALRSVGFALLVAGLAVVVGIVVVTLCEREATTVVERVLKWAIIAAAIGFGVVLVAVIKERRAASKSDKYKDVER